METIRNLDQRDRLVQTMNKIKVLHSGARRALNKIINRGNRQDSRADAAYRQVAAIRVNNVFSRRKLVDNLHKGFALIEIAKIC